MCVCVCVCVCMRVCVFAIHSFVFEATESRQVSKGSKLSTAHTHVGLNMSIWPHPFLYLKKEPKTTFTRKRNGAIDLKLGMQTQLFK